MNNSIIKTLDDEISEGLLSVILVLVVALCISSIYLI